MNADSLTETENHKASVCNAAKRKPKRERPISTPPSRQSVTPTRTNPPRDARLASRSTPRPRSRPPAVRSLSSPLTRSMSVRVTRVKDTQETSDLLTSTYKEHFQPPETLSRKLQSLNLETTLTINDSLTGHCDSGTTYRESYCTWRSPNSPEAATSTPSVLQAPGKERQPVPGLGKELSLQARVPHSIVTDTTKTAHRTTSGVEAVTSSSISDKRKPEAGRAKPLPLNVTQEDPYFRVLPQSNVIVQQESGYDSQPYKRASVSRTLSSDGSENGTSPLSTKPTNGNGVTSPNSTGGHASPKPTNGNTVVGIEGTTSPGNSSARNIRAYQLRSSPGNNAFVYGSHLGS